LYERRIFKLAYTQIDTVSNNAIQPMNVANSPTVYSNHQSYGSYWAESSTNLVANGLFTGTAHDGGSANNNYNRLRVIVSATAGVGQGHLIIEQSTDGTTFRETQHLPIPSDSGYYSYEFAWNMRYIRIKFQNGAVAQTAFFLQSYGVRMDGGLDHQQTPTFIHSTTALGVSATFTGVTLNTGSQNSYLTHKSIVTADQSGTLQLQQSRDGSTWRTTKSVAITASTPTMVNDDLIYQYCRVVYVNGATAQTSFELASTLTHV
jgi:hypothetical protein